MRNILWVVLLSIPLACYGDSIRAGGKQRDGVYVGRSGHDYVIKSPDGSAQIISERRVDVATITQSEDRADILARWKANQNAPIQAPKADTEKRTFKTIRLLRELDPETAKLYARVKAETDANNAAYARACAQARAEARAAEEARLAAVAAAKQKQEDDARFAAAWAYAQYLRQQKEELYYSSRRRTGKRKTYTRLRNR